MLQFNGVSKFYGTRRTPKHILKDVSVNLDLSKNTALLAKNGAGKSTILRMIGECESISKGTISNPYNTSWPLALQGGIQNSLTGKENAVAIATMYGIIDKAGYIQAVKDFSELYEDFDRPVKNYSHGMRSRLAFSLSIHVDFDVYLVDEIISVGDEKFRQKANQVITSMLGERAFLIVSHNMQLLRKHCEQAIVLNNHKLTVYDSIEEGIASYESIS